MTAANLTGLLGIGFVGVSCFLLSRNRRAIDWRTVGWGLALQAGLALLIIRGENVAALFAFMPGAQRAAMTVVACQALALWLVTRYAPTFAARVSFAWVRRLVWVEAIFYLLKFNAVGALFESLKSGAAQVLKFSGVGATFVFGVLGSEETMRGAFAAALGEKAGAVAFVFAFQVLPTIIFVASIFSVLYYLNLMQPLIRAIARFINRFLRASGAETLDVAANIFMGQTEAPLTIRPYLANLTRSELFTVMVSGMAHCSAGILIVYVAVSGVDARHLLASVIMTAPGSIMLAKMVFPETETPETAQPDPAGAPVSVPATADDANRPVNVIDAAARGASDGMVLAANVAAMLIAFIALIALLNGVWASARDAALVHSEGVLHGLLAAVPSTIQQVLGVLFAPVAFLSGVPWGEAVQVGNLLGTRIVLNEFVGFIELGKMREALSPKAFLLSTYLLCGFGSLTSIAIQAGGIGALVPQRRAELASLGFLAVVVGVLSNVLAASIAGILF